MSGTHAQWGRAWRESAANERAQGNTEGADYGDYLADQNDNADKRKRSERVERMRRHS
jgi:hypothetical protein